MKNLHLNSRKVIKNHFFPRRTILSASLVSILSLCTVPQAFAGYKFDTELPNNGTTNISDGLVLSWNGSKSDLTIAENVIYTSPENSSGWGYLGLSLQSTVEQTLNSYEGISGDQSKNHGAQAKFEYQF